MSAADDVWLDPGATRALLDAYGIPLVPERVGSSAEEAVAAARELGFPAVVKTAAAGVHKTETGGVALDLPDDHEGAILEASGGTEALAIAAQGGAIDLLLADVVMPGMNGRESAQRLVRDRAATKVLFTSGYPADTAVRRGIVEAGAAFIKKPYLPDDLARKIREVLDSE